MSVYIKNVRSNVKSSDGLLWEVELGEKTLIVGANGKGKSRIVNAVELALTGRASDLAGKVDVAREADLLALSPGRNANLYAEVVLSNTEVVAFGVECAGAGKARKADHEVPAWFAKQELLPVRAVREAMLGSADTACRQFLSWAGAGSGRSIMDMLSPSLTPAYNRLVALTPGADITGLETAARKKKLEANAAVKALESALAGSGVVAAAPDDADMAAAQEASQAARTVLVRAQAAQMRANSAQRTEMLAQQVVSMEATLAEAESTFKQWETYVGSLVKPTGNSVVAQHLLELLAFTVDGKFDDCLLCDGAPGAAHFKARHAEVNTAMGARMKQASEYAGADANLRLARTQMNTVESQLFYARKTLEAAVEPPEEGDIVDYAAAAAAYDVVENRLRQLQSARAAWQSYRSVMTQLDTARAEAATWKSLEDALGQAGRILLTDALTAFKIKVQSFLPATDIFNLTLSEGAREVFQAGFVRDGTLHTALSGAEWARLTLAMASAILPANSQLAVITPEERAFDPKTLAAVMKSLSSAPGQVIITSPVAPHGKVPAGWTVVEL